MATDGYRTVRVPEDVYEELMAFHAHLLKIGVNGLPPALKMPVKTIGDAVCVGIRAARKVVG